MFCVLSAASVALAQAPKPTGATATVAAIGEIGEAEKRIVFNSLQATLSRSYRLIPQEEYRRAEEAAFASLSVEQCTEEYCIRKIQELLQVERLIVLQIIRAGTITQLTLTLVRDQDKIVRAETCQNCSLLDLTDRVAKLAGEVGDADVGGAVARTPEPAPPPPAPRPQGSGQVFIASQPSGAEIILDGKTLEQKTDALLENVPAGEHTLVLNKDHLSAARTFTVAPNRLLRLELELKTASAELLISSTPFNATVLLDGKERCVAASRRL